jgi:hypothetical protein
MMRLVPSRKPRAHSTGYSLPGGARPVTTADQMAGRGPVAAMLLGCPRSPRGRRGAATIRPSARAHATDAADT